MIYLLNTPVLTAYGDYRFTGPLEPANAKARLRNGYESAIGHAPAAEFLSRLFNMDIPYRRITIKMNPGDQALVLRLNDRLPEVKTLTLEEMSEFNFELGWIERLA